MRQVTLTGILVLLTVVAPAQLPAQTSVTGVAYAQYVYQLADTASHANGFDVTRSYVNLLGKFAGGVNTRVTADIYRQAGDASLRYRLKYAFVGYTPEGSALTFRIGQLPTPWIEWEEALWDYRLQGSVALDRNGYLSSSDFGLSVDGRWGAERVNGAIAVLNGEGYNGGTGDQRKDVAARISLRLRSSNDSSRVGGLRLSAYGQLGAPTGGGVRRRGLVMSSYRTKRFTVAAEYAATADSSTAGPAALRYGSVASVFGVYRFAPAKAALIARFDVVDADHGISGDRVRRLITGVSYQPAPSLRVLLDLDHLTYEGTPSPAQQAVRTQAAFRAQFAF